MSEKLIRGYRFATEEQWNACLFTRADRDSREARNGLHPFNPYAGPAIRFESKGGSAPTVSHVGEFLWRDDERNLRRLFYSDDKQVAVKAPYAIARATRLVANSKALWAAAAAPESLQAFELESLTRQLTVEIPNARVLDIADDGHDGLFVLIERNHAWEFARYDCAGELRLDTSFALTGVSDPSMLVYLRRVDQLIILASNNSKLHFFSPDSGSPKFSLPISAIRPCFDVVALGSDDRAVLFIAGTDGQPFGGLHHVLTLNADGDLLGEVELDEKPTGVTGNRTTLLVTTARGILRFKTSNSVPRDSFEVKTALMTPMLQSPSTNNSRRWLRDRKSVV